MSALAEHESCRRTIKLGQAQAAYYKTLVASAVYRFLAQLKQGSAPRGGKNQQSQVAPDSPVEQWTAKQAAWWFIRDPSDLKEKEQQALEAIRQASPTADTVYELAQDFMQMLRCREGQRLDVWLGQVKASHISELQRFAPRASNETKMPYWQVSLYRRATVSWKERSTN